MTRMRGGTTWAAAWLDRPDRPGDRARHGRPGRQPAAVPRLRGERPAAPDRRRAGRDRRAACWSTRPTWPPPAGHGHGAAQQRDRLGVPLPGLDVVRLSATGAPTGRPFVLDVDAHRDNAVAWRRLTAGKRLTVRRPRRRTAPRTSPTTVARPARALAGLDGRAGAGGAGRLQHRRPGPRRAHRLGRSWPNRARHRRGLRPADRPVPARSTGPTCRTGSSTGSAPAARRRTGRPCWWPPRPSRSG